MDTGYTFTDGSSTITEVYSPIEAFVEYPRIDFQDPKRRKRLTRCDIWLSNISGEVEMKLYWRPDNSQRWQFWDSTAQCAIMTDAATTGPHVWKNLLPEQRPLIKSFSIPDEIDGLSTYDLSTGFGFQIRIAWTGSLKIERAVLWATVVDDSDYAIREGQDPACKANDVSGNELRYEIPIFTPTSGIADAILALNYGSEIHTEQNQDITVSSYTSHFLFGVSIEILGAQSSIDIIGIDFTGGVSASSGGSWDGTPPHTVDMIEPTSQSWEVQCASSGSIVLTHTGVNTPITINITKQPVPPQ